mgnify:CR=1 FL=1
MKAEAGFHPDHSRKGLGDLEVDIKEKRKLQPKGKKREVDGLERGLTERKKLRAEGKGELKTEREKL